MEECREEESPLGREEGEAEEVGSRSGQARSSGAESLNFDATISTSSRLRVMAELWSDESSQFKALSASIPGRKKERERANLPRAQAVFEVRREEL